MRYFFPLHLDAGNRGCEGIAKGTAVILGSKKEDMIGLCRNIKLDKKLGINNYISLVATQNQPKDLPLRVIDKVLRLLHIKKQQNSVPNSVNDYSLFYDKMKKEDIMVSTGGDLMCYPTLMSVTTNNMACERGHKTILWGCSMGPDNLTPEKESTLHRFTLIYARESLSYNFFKSIGLKNVCCFPDPAFVLEPETCTLPRCFQRGDVIGINLSNYVLGDYSLNTSFGNKVNELINYIIKNTNLQILLIPHVSWGDQDDRVVAKNINNLFKATGRVSVLDIDNKNYLQIRYVISRCRFFIGGRTHAVISAYCTCVPTIAIGYSVKSHGIANDLNLPDVLVVDSKVKTLDNNLLYAFNYMRENEAIIKQQLQKIIPDYRNRIFGIREYLKKI